MERQVGLQIRGEGVKDWLDMRKGVRRERFSCRRFRSSDQKLPKYSKSPTKQSSSQEPKKVSSQSTIQLKLTGIRSVDIIGAQGVQITAVTHRKSLNYSTGAWVKIHLSISLLVCRDARTGKCVHEHMGLHGVVWRYGFMVWVYGCVVFVLCICIHKHIFIQLG